MQKGYSLIELMVVIAVIGILTGVALPNYKNYTIRANMIELFTLLQPAKLAVTEALISDAPLETINNHHLGITQKRSAGKIQEIVIEKGVITITGHAQKLGLSHSQPFQIIMSPHVTSDSIDWQCTTAAEFQYYMPASCR